MALVRIVPFCLAHHHIGAYTVEKVFTFAFPTTTILKKMHLKVCVVML